MARARLRSSRGNPPVNLAFKDRQRQGAAAKHSIMETPDIEPFAQRRFSLFQACLRFDRLDQAGAAEDDNRRPNAFFLLNEFRLEQFKLEAHGPQFIPI